MHDSTGSHTWYLNTVDQCCPRTLRYIWACEVSRKGLEDWVIRTLGKHIMPPGYQVNGLKDITPLAYYVKESASPSPSYRSQAKAITT